jgi:Flp pilus assembly protein CpaB
MSRRARAAGFAVAAALCAGLAAGATGGEPDAAAQFGALREVVVAAAPLPAHRALRPKSIAEALELRRVPERFVPPDALGSPAEALGRSPATTIPAGGYLLGSQLEAPAEQARRPHPLSADRLAVEVSVEGAGALAARPRRRVDVVVTTEPGPGGSGRTYVAAPDVGLLDLRAGGSEAGDEILPAAGGEAWIATLALSRGQALRVIHAESFARSIRLLG